MKSIFKFCFGGMVVSLLFASSVMAGPVGGLEPGMPPKAGCTPEMNGGEEPFFLDSLNLTAAQIELLKKNKLEKQKSMVKMRAELETLQIDLADQSDASKPDMTKIESLTRQMGEVHGKMIAERVKAIIFLRSILTDDQRKALDSQTLRFMDKMGIGGPGDREHGPRHMKKGKNR